MVVPWWCALCQPEEASCLLSQTRSSGMCQQVWLSSWWKQPYQIRDSVFRSAMDTDFDFARRGCYSRRQLLNDKGMPQLGSCWRYANVPASAKGRKNGNKHTARCNQSIGLLRSHSWTPGQMRPGANMEATRPTSLDIGYINISLNTTSEGHESCLYQERARPPRSCAVTTTVKQRNWIHHADRL